VVTEGTDVLGIISIRDLVRHFVDADGGPVQALTNVYRPLSVLMQKAIETIGSDETAMAAAQRMADKHIGALFVIEADELVGIITEGDLVRKLLAYQLDPEAMRVGALMNSPLLDIDINRTIRDASERMAAKRIRHLAVTEHEKVVGVLSIRDLVKMVAIRRPLAPGPVSDRCFHCAAPSGTVDFPGTCRSHTTSHDRSTHSPLFMNGAPDVGLACQSGNMDRARNPHGA